jgi:hypothetical protein
MITVRTYWKPADAALAKSVLDDYEILCALIHENANIYCLAPMAIPVRLQVHESEAGQAVQILSGNVDALAEIEAQPTEEAPAGAPWELLVVAFYLLPSALCFIQTKYPSRSLNELTARRGIAAVDIAHFLGWLGLIFAVLLILLYPYVVRSAIGESNGASSAGPEIV